MDYRSQLAPPAIKFASHPYPATAWPTTRTLNITRNHAASELELPPQHTGCPTGCSLCQSSITSPTGRPSAAYTYRVSTTLTRPRVGHDISLGSHTSSDDTLIRKEASRSELTGQLKECRRSGERAPLRQEEHSSCCTSRTGARWLRIQSKPD